MADKLPKANIDEQRYRVLIDNAPEVVLIFDAASGRFIDANQAAITLLQFSREKLLQLGPPDISPSLYQGVSATAKAEVYIQQALQGGNPVFDWVHVDYYGREIPCEIRLIRFPPYDRSIIRASVIDLTEKRKIEAALAKSEERLKLALKTTGLGCYDWYPRTNQAHWDTGMHNLFGLDPADSIDRATFFFQSIHPDDKARVQLNFQELMQPDSKHHSFEYRFRIITDGRVVYMYSTGIVMRTTTGEVERLTGTVQDITERVQINEQLKKQAALLDNVSDAVIATDTSFVVSSWNKAAEKMYGWPAEEAIGQPLGDLIPLTYLEESREEVVARFLQEGVWNGETIQENRAGKAFYVLASVTALKDKEGKITGSIGVNRDISDRKQVELALRESEARYRSLVQHFPNGLIALFDQDLRYTLVDGEGISRLNINSADFIGKRLRDIFPKARYERDEPAQLAALQGKKSTRVIPVRDSYYSITTLPVRDTSGEIIAGLEVSQDISTLVETEKKLSKTLEQLQLAIQTAELGIWQYDFATNRMEGNARLLEMYGLDPSTQKLTREYWGERVHPDNKDAVLRGMAALFQGKQLAKTEFRIILPNGDIRHIQMAGGPIFDQEGKLVEHIGVNIDITSIKKNADALQEREAFLRAIYDNSLNAVLVADDQGNLQSFNQAACQMLGYPAAALKKMTLAELPITNIADKEAWYQEIVNTGKDIGDLVLSLPDQQVRTTHYYAVHIKEDFNLCVLTDITDRKQAEIKLRESEEKFSKSFHENPTPMMLVDTREKSVIDVNKAYTQLSGYLPEEVINIPGQLGFAMTMTGTENSLERALEIINTHDRISNFEISVKSKAGKINSLIAFAEPLDIQNRHLHIVSTIDISERKLTEEALRQAKNYAESLIETANVMVIGLDQAGTINIFNRAAQEITGYKQEELAGKNWFETIVPRDHYPEVWDQFNRLTARGQILTTFENPILTRTGDERIISWQNSVMYDQEEPAGTLSFGIDITQRKKIEETLRDREELFHTVFDQQFQFMAILSPKGQILEVNDLLVRVTGVNYAETIGTYFWELPIWSTLPEWQVIIKDQVMEAGRMHKALLAEEMYTTSSGELRWTDAAYTAIRSQEGELRFVLVQATDITERKLAAEKLLKAQRELFELTNRFQISTRAAQLGIWDWNMEKDHLIWDETMLEIYGLDQAQFSGGIPHWKRYLHPADTGIFQEMVDWRAKKEFTTEFRILRPDGAIRHIKAVASVQWGEAGTALGMIGANWDITQEKEAEHERIRARQLEIRNRELEQFAYVASHDLQEPLRTVISFVGLLKRNYQEQLDQEALEYMNFVVEASSRMSQLIRGLLDYSRIGSNRELSLVDSAKLVRQILEDLAAQINTTQAIIEVAPLPQIKGYKTELRMLFQNLISNAIKFRKPGQQAVIQIGVQEKKNQWVFFVQDDGIGIDPIFQDQIFVLFQRLHRREEYEGTGIGLAHCRKIVELHGGTIRVASEVDKGSTFFFSIAKSEKALD